ncbi:isocitrate lyase/PEP mutase family protein [Bordetella pseudohinzii]|uniref:2,3-dimethylmalate lyase n=3 Tax=Bordetella pseudohinzii TaxID=1331258 RepID=A0A0M7HA95_9BORD|nr:isocitrate lyase/PEP mutase family protein [Bordetella pseudohinzii]ANY16863.1 carboxyvinyl-carboxyphosphonate phosphorylmutase [Bordetella pseudohinzii]CUJ06663.1 2%2C3-dimethylmalate lyase [Bordetella pseudohinzii]
MNQASRLRAMIHANGMIVAPGAFDGITARLTEQAGFEAVYMTGAGTSASKGYPDFGLLTMSEMADNAGLIARAARIPVIADADTGYGNELNVTRTVQEYEMRGVAALHIEDQVSPKRCGHLDGKELVSREDYLAKIRAAVAARRNPDFTIIARTDARAVASLDEALWRANAALAAGADMVFVEAAQTLEEIALVPQAVRGPCLFNLVKGGKSPDVTLEQLRGFGYKLTILPSLLLVAVVQACDQALGDLQRTGVAPDAESGPKLQERARRFGADEWNALRTRFREPPEAAAHLDTEHAGNARENIVR